MGWADDMLQAAARFSTDPKTKKAREILTVSGDVLQDLWYAHQGGKVATTLAVVSGVSRVVEKLLPEPTSSASFLRKSKYKIRSDGAEKLFFTLLKEDSEGVVVYNNDDFIVKVWEDAGTAASIYVGDGQEQLENLGVQDEDKLSATLHRIVWGKGADLMLLSTDAGSVITGNKSRHRHLEEGDLQIVPMTDSPKYIGLPASSYFVDRLKRHLVDSETETRSMLLVGPSGVGKGVLAREIARGLYPEGRVLKIASNAVVMIPLPALLDLVAALKPAVLLLDDLSIDYDSGRADDGMLALFEALRGRCRVVLGTVMANRDDDEADSFSCAGLRPGRVDEVHFLRVPQEVQRRDLLNYYFKGFTVSEAVLAEVVAETEGLTGAYLAEIALRIRRFGTESWEEEVNSVWRMSDKTRKEKE